MAYIGTLYLFGIDCGSSKTKWEECYDINNCGEWFATIYKDHKGLYCGQSKSKGKRIKDDECEESCGCSDWKTTYYNSNEEYCGRSVSKMIKNAINIQYGIPHIMIQKELYAALQNV